jgi:hypothetical protein
LILVSPADFLDILFHIFSVQSLVAPRFTTPIITIWYISIILAYYLIFAWLQKTFRSLPALMTAFIVGFILAAFLRRFLGIIDHRFFYHYFVYAAGLLAAKMGVLDRLLDSRYFLLDKFTFAIFGLLLLRLTRKPLGSVDLLFLVAVPFFIVSMVILALSLSKLIILANINMRFFSYAATASYFAYLLHRPTWVVMYSIYSPPEGVWSFVYAAVIGSAIIIMISHWLQIQYNALLARVSRR